MDNISDFWHDNLNEWIWDSFLIIDMQDYFLPNELRKNWELYILARKRLIESILNRAHKYLEHWKKVFIVEFEWISKTIREIEEPLWKSSEKLKKIVQDITNKNNIWIDETMDKLISAWNNIELSWVNATSCVLKSNFWLIMNWFKTKVRIDCILNWNFSNEWLIRNNSLSYIYERYSKFMCASLDKDFDLSYSLDLLSLCPQKHWERLIWNV